MIPDLSSSSDEEVLVLAISPERPTHAWDELVARYHDPFIRFAARLYPQLPPLGRDLCEDVVQSTWELLLRRGPIGFAPTKATAKQYLYGLCRDAIRQVRRDEGLWKPTMMVAYLGVSLGGMEERAVTDMSPVTIKQPGDDFSIVVVASIFHDAAVTAPGDVLRALRLVYQKDMSLNKAADELGMSRTTMTRHLQRWAREHIPLG